jgi:hypothetical protein
MRPGWHDLQLILFYYAFVAPLRVGGAAFHAIRDAWLDERATMQWSFVAVPRIAIL